MGNKGAAVLKALVHHYHQQHADQMLALLPEEEQRALAAIQVPEDATSLKLESCEETLGNVHYSWFAKVLTQHPDRLQPLLLAALPSHVAQRLSKLIDVPVAEKSVPGCFRSFLLQRLYKELLGSDVVPSTLLPRGDLNILLKLDKARLVELVDLMGVHDLAGEMRKVVDKRVIKQVQTVLRKNQRKYFEICLTRKEKILSRGKSLLEVVDTPISFRTALHQKGLARLAMALGGQNPSLVWHVCHILDTGRGQALLERALKEGVSQVSSALAAQAVDIAKLLIPKTS